MTGRRLPTRCAYCGAHLRTNGTACSSHSDLPNLDPHHVATIRRPLQAPPDMPVLILTKAAA